MQLSHSIAMLCAFAVAACAGLSAPEIIQHFAAQVQPKLNAVQNTPAEDLTPETLETLASSISEAAKSADAQLKALKGQPIDIVLGVDVTDTTDAVNVMNAFVNGVKESTNAVKTSVKGLLSATPSGVHAVARPDVTTLTTDISSVAADLDSLLSDLTQLGSDTSQF